MRSVYKLVLVSCGFAALGAGVAGIVLPLLPTTPFLLVAAACFVRSSPRLYHWLIAHPWFGVYIRSYRELRAIPMAAKVMALLLLWPAVTYSGLFVVDNRLVTLLLLLIAVTVTIYLLRLKTLTRDMLPVSWSDDRS